MVATIVTGSLVAVAGPDLSSPSAVVRSYVPADGASLFSRQQSTTGGKVVSASVLTESARVAGSTILAGLDWTLATQLIGALNGDRDLLARSRYWRTITSEAGARSGQPGGALTRVYRVDGDVALLVESGPLGAFSYSPHLVELPADVGPGSTWHGSGQVGGPQITYRAAFAAAAAEAGCLKVTGTVTYAFAGQTVPRKLGRTWCAEGLVAETDEVSGTAVQRSRTAPPTLPPPSTEDLATAWDPGRWKAQTFRSVSVDPNLGEGPISGAPAALPPVLTRSGMIVQAVESVHDLLAMAPMPGSRWRSRWRAHPGGAVLTLSQFGDISVATTSARRMVAYDADGIRRWSLTTDEVITAQPVRATDADMVAVTLGGEVLRIDVASGTVRWRTQPGSDVGLPPGYATEVAVIADRGGSIHGLDLSDGRVRWEDDVQEPAAIDGRDGRVGVASLGYVTYFDARSGEPIWRASYPGTATDLLLTSGNAVLTGSDGLRAFHLDGRLAYTRHRGVDVSTDGHWLVLWGPQRAEVQGATGTVQSLATPVESAGSPHRHLVGTRGVYLLDSTWDLRGWTDE